MYNEECEPIVRNSKFTGNYASIGGGMANYGGARPVVEGCIFEDNEGADGGGMYNYKSAPDVSRCVFSGNEGNGAGMCNWGIGASPLVVNCVFADGAGYTAVYNVTTYEDFNNVPVFTNCTFRRNGYAMYNLFSAPTVTNCILWATGEGYPAVFNYIRADASFRHCDIEGSGGSGDWNGDMGRDGGGNIEESPEFVDETQPAGTWGSVWFTADDGLRLQDSSPCIDTADGNAAPERDIMGVGRYDEPGVSGGVGEPNYVEIGAYEYHPVEVHFSGATISDVYDSAKTWSEAFVDDDWSDINVGVGGYADTAAEIPDAVYHSLDSIAIRDGVKLTVWSGENFQGDILLERRGPAVIYNVRWKGDSRVVEAMTEEWEPEALQYEFPQWVRKWSETDMWANDYWWGKGSFKIE